MAKKEKVENQAQELRTNETTKTRVNFDISRLTQEYFYPDVLDGKIEELKIPTTRELAFLGNDNVDNIRRFFREEEQKLQKIQAEITRELKQLEGVAQLGLSGLDFKAKCDWHGHGYARMDSNENSEMSYAEVSREEGRRMKLVEACHFGRYAAEWCERVPCSHCDRHCYHTATMLHMPVARGEIGNPESIQYLQAIDRELQKEQCQFYDACHGKQPFLSETCVMAEPEKLAECQTFLKEKRADIAKRQKFMQKYMHNLTYVVKRCDRHYARPTFFEFDNCYGSSKAKLVAIIVKTEEGVGFAAGVRLLEKPDESERGLTKILLFPEYAAAENEDNEGSKKHLFPVDLVKKDIFIRADRIYMPGNDFLYLAKHQDFRKIWIEMSDFRNKAITKDELTQFFAQFDAIKWPPYPPMPEDAMPLW